MRSTGLGLFALLAVAWFLFSVTDGNFLIHGDDMFILDHFHHYHPEWSYLRNMGERQFLTLGYVSLFRVLGDDTHRMHNVFLAWHVLNAGLCFFVLKKIFQCSPRSGRITPLPSLYRTFGNPHVALRRGVLAGDDSLFHIRMDCF